MKYTVDDARKWACMGEYCEILEEVIFLKARHAVIEYSRTRQKELADGLT